MCCTKTKMAPVNSSVVMPAMLEQCRNATMHAAWALLQEPVRSCCLVVMVAPSFEFRIWEAELWLGMQQQLQRCARVVPLT